MSVEHTTLLNGRVSLLQPSFGLRASTDSVLLSASLDAKKGEHILDMGCGSGAVGLCAVERLKDQKLNLTGIDIQPDLIEIAKQNAPFYQFITGDITDKSHFEREAFDHILMNPPYFEDGKKQPSMDESRDIAFRTDNFDQWMASALHWVKHGGSVSVIHKPDALDQILMQGHRKFGAIEIWPVHSKPNGDAIRVIVRMIRNRKTPMVMHPPIILFNEDGSESERSKSILRHAKGLVE
jgi:tRNA1(Val) A37 N6-methylase TrmN6